MITPTHDQLNVAVAAARAVIKADSTFYNSMITDEFLIPIVQAALIAALNQKANP